MVAGLCFDVRALRPVPAGRAAIAKAAKKRWAKVRKQAKKTTGQSDFGGALQVERKGSIATSRTLPWLASGWGCRSRRLSRA
jgi:hypothetical protein